MSTVKKSVLIVAALTVSSWIAFGQIRNWPTYGGDAQRSGSQGVEARITPATVKDLQLLWKIKLEVQSRGMRPVMPPVILGRLISYRGFRELAFVGTNPDIVYALDADIGTMFWQKHLEYSTRDPQVMTSSWRCPGGLTAMPTMPAPAPRGGAAGRGAPAPAAGQRGSAFIGGPASVYAISSDGRLHRLNTSTGDDMTQPVSVLPANARATSLNMVDNVIYTATSHDCNGAPNAVWAIDLNVDPPSVRSFALNSGDGWGGSVSGLGGPVIGNDGVVYVQTGDGQGSVTKGEWSNSLLALTPRELQVKDFFTRERNVDTINPGDVMPVASPVVVNYNNRDLIVAPCWDGQICLLDSASLGGSDHSTPIHGTPRIVQASRNLSTTAERGVWGSISSWQDMDGTRWILVPAMGPPSPDLNIPITNGASPNGFIVAFKLRDQGGKMTLEPSWISRDLNSPMPPVVANGVVFALSAGEFTRQLTKTADDLSTLDEKPKGSTRATLYALDARTGKELYSSRNLVAGPASLTGLSVANGRVYFGGIDGTFYAFGMYLEQ
jgi:outer membrane protein assembly factor BamB